MAASQLCASDIFHETVNEYLMLMATMATMAKDKQPSIARPPRFRRNAARIVLRSVGACGCYRRRLTLL
jgi:hypothetical protein